MSRTKIGGNRIQDKTLELKHLSSDIKIPESYLQLKYPTHNHENKAALDIIRNSNPALTKIMDLTEIALTILQVAEARDQGETLRSMMDGKASKKELQSIIDELDEFKGENGSLSEAYNHLVTYLDNMIDDHAGHRSHEELDLLYSEVVAARDKYKTLGDRLNKMSSGGSSGGGGGGALTPWFNTVTLAEEQLEVTFPNNYVMGGNSLQVFDGPLLLTEGDEGDYVESSTDTITLNYELPSGTVLSVTGVNGDKLFDWVLRIRSSDKQEEVEFADRYRPSMNDLVVYEDGLLLQPIIDYTEIDEYTIKFNTPLVRGSVINIYKRRT